MNTLPEPEAVKLPPSYDSCLLGATVDPHGADRFVYSLRKLTLFEMKRNECDVADARQYVTDNFVMPMAREHGPLAPVFVNDELVKPLADRENKIITPPKFNRHRK